MDRLRTPIAAMFAAGVTFGLFLFMFKLISSEGKNNDDLAAIAGIHFGPIEISEEIMTRNRRIPKKTPSPEKQPQTPKMQVSKMDKVVQNMPELDLPDLDVPLSNGEGMYIGSFAGVDRTEEGEIIPVVVIRPIYPKDAALKGQEGWVKIGFTITAIGTVKDPVVIESKPPRVFNRAAVRAILKWKFKPRVINGVAVDRPATQIINFSLNRSGG